MSDLTAAQRKLIVNMGFRSNVLANGDEYSPKWWLEGGGAVKSNVAEALIRRGYVRLTGREGGHPGILLYTVTAKGRGALGGRPQATD